MASILFVEDDPSARAALELALARFGHSVTSRATGEEGLEALRARPPEIAILDVMLPGVDGVEVCRRIRRDDLRGGAALPVILLTARGDDLDVVLGLEAGADDYVVKPVEPRVLDARIRAVLRRADQTRLDRTAHGDLVIDRTSLKVTKAGADIRLTPTELRLLLELTRRAGRALPRRHLLAAAFTAVALLSSMVASGVSYVLLRRATLQRAQDAVLTDVRRTLARQVPPELPPDAGGLLGAQLEEDLAAPPGRKAAAVPAPPGGSPPIPAPGRLDVPVGAAFARRAQTGVVFQRVVRDGTPYLLVGARVTGYRTGGGRAARTTPPTVYVTASLRREAADLALLTRVLMIENAPALVPALALALLATRGVLRPVRRLGAAARALGEGGLETRVSVRGRDELADLARTFNRTAEALERTVTEPRAMEKASRRFVADVSHELRTPLTSIAATDVLAEEAGPGEGAAPLVACETRRLGRLVEHLIEISRFDAGAAALVRPRPRRNASACAPRSAARWWPGCRTTRRR
ncbi:response regulator [Actinomadura graeca]|uniref:response regulator n=1 Tax=Actinomadura graeca TaxID=2750812 RepID=UPI00235948E6|nr:response regulator [Actinomadura graeca]